MASKQMLINEIEAMPVCYIDEILRLVRSFKYEKQKEAAAESDTPLTDSLIGILEGSGVKCVNDIKDMRLAKWL
jgi:hypothetical protein